ncbi:MAG: hypothetical protein ACHQX1_03460 [Candidatus Micrarchaeales archaeon]
MSRARDKLPLRSSQRAMLNGSVQEILRPTELHEALRAKDETITMLSAELAAKTQLVNNIDVEVEKFVANKIKISYEQGTRLGLMKVQVWCSLQD